MILLFDLDDTLFDFKATERLAFAAVLEQFNVEFTETYLGSYRVHSQGLWRKVELGEIDKQRVRTERFRLFFDQYGIEGDSKLASEVFLNRLSEGTELVSSARQCLDDLAKSYPMGVVTNGIEDVQHRRLRSTQLENYFAHIVTSEGCGYAKPRREIFDRAMELFGQVDPSKYIMVGDRHETDIEGANRVGMTSIHFHKDPSKSSTSADYFIQDLSLLPELVQQIVEGR